MKNIQLIFTICLCFLVGGVGFATPVLGSQGTHNISKNETNDFTSARAARPNTEVIINYTIIDLLQKGYFQYDDEQGTWRLTKNPFAYGSSYESKVVCHAPECLLIPDIPGNELAVLIKMQK